METEFNEKKEFSQRLVKALLEKGYKSKHASSGVAIRDLSIATGISMEMARRYTLGLAIPKSNVIKIIADWLNVNPLWLRDGIAVSTTDRQYTIPLIKWQDISSWKPDHTSGKVYHTHLAGISPQAFAVQLAFDLNPVLIQGTTLIFEPQKEFKHKSLVLVATTVELVELKQVWFENNLSYVRSIGIAQDQQRMMERKNIKGVLIAADFSTAL